MSAESPIAAIASVTAIFGYAVVRLTTGPIIVGHPSFAMILAFFGASIGAVWGLARTRSLTGVRDCAFVASIVAGWIGIVIYLACLVATLL